MLNRESATEAVLTMLGDTIRFQLAPAFCERLS
jgi:hypothetical protein